MIDRVLIFFCLFFKIYFYVYEYVVSQIKKFKDALAKHGSERCSFGPTKGLEESELKILASIGEINSSPLLCPKLGKLEDLVMESHDFSGVLSMESNSRGIMLDAIY